VTYLLATPSGWTGPPAYEAVVLDYIAKYVDRFSPRSASQGGIPHYMEAAVPDRIVQGAGEGHREPITVMRRPTPILT
jgi:hypothetical protein